MAHGALALVRDEVLDQYLVWREDDQLQLLGAAIRQELRSEAAPWLRRKELPARRGAGFVGRPDALPAKRAGRAPVKRPAGAELGALYRSAPLIHYDARDPDRVASLSAQRRRRERHRHEQGDEPRSHLCSIRVSSRFDDGARAWLGHDV